MELVIIIIAAVVAILTISAVRDYYIEKLKAQGNVFYEINENFLSPGISVQEASRMVEEGKSISVIRNGGILVHYKPRRNK